MDPQTGNLHVAQVQPQKRQKDKTKKKKKSTRFLPRRGTETVTSLTYLVTLIALYISPRDTLTEKGRNNYLSSEPIQFLYALNIALYYT